MDQMSDKTDNRCKCNSKNCFSVNLKEMQRDFKRFKVDESVKESINGSKNDNSIHCNYFSLKLSPISPKMSCHEKRSAINGIRRQRPHSLSSIKVRNHGLSAFKSKSTEEDTECPPKDDSNDSLKYFSDLKLSSSEESPQNGKHLYFSKDFKLESNEWRNHFVDNNHKKCGNTDNKTPKDIKVKSIRSRKLKFKDNNTCARQALCDPTVQPGDASVEELAAYLDDTLYLPRKMSFMAEMMYT